MDTPSVRVLVAEDFEPFRRLLCSLVQKMPGVRHIWETSDGLAAVQLAQQLQPDLILLDIGLRSLNGIEAARQIRNVAPQAKILFVTQQSSRAVIEAALATGASGYVVKQDAGDEVQVAINAVLRGEIFVGSRFSSKDVVSQWKRDQKSHSTDQPRATIPLRDREAEASHEVYFCGDEMTHIRSFGEFARDALKRGSAVIVLLTRSHQDAVLSMLKAAGPDVVTALEEGRYIPISVADALSDCMVDGVPLPDKFMKSAHDLLARVARTQRRSDVRIAACGEAAPFLLSQGNIEGAIRLEELWDDLARRFHLEVLCGYPQAREEYGPGICDRICAVHSAAHSR